MFDRMELYLHLSKRPLYRFPPTGIGRAWKPLGREELVEHARKTRDSFASGREHIFVHFAFRCAGCNKLSMFAGPNQFWPRYRCGVCGGEAAFESGWYYLAINTWQFRRFNVVEGIGNAVKLS